jgi:RNA polymerase sigma-70 factor (ECF subfamily)
MKTCKSYERAGKGNNRTAGFEENFEVLLRRHETEAHQYANRLAGNSEEAKELVQHACYRALKYWDSYDPVGSFQSWYLTIVRNLFKDARKRRRMISLTATLQGHEDLTVMEAFPDGQPGPCEQLEKRETAEAVQEAVMALKAGYRAVVTLCDLEGMQYEDAARKLGVPAGTVRSRLSRARAALRRNAALAEII